MHLAARAIINIPEASWNQTPSEIWSPWLHPCKIFLLLASQGLASCIMTIFLVSAYLFFFFKLRYHGNYYIVMQLVCRNGVRAKQHPK